MPKKSQNPVLDAIPAWLFQEPPKPAEKKTWKRSKILCDISIVLPLCCKQTVADNVHSPCPSPESGGRSNPNYRWTVRPKEKKYPVQPKPIPRDPADDIPNLDDVNISICYSDDGVSLAEVTSFENIADQLHQTDWNDDHRNQLTTIPDMLVDSSEEPVPPPAVNKSTTKPNTNQKCGESKKQKQIVPEHVSVMSDKKIEKKIRQKERRMAERARKEQEEKAKEAKKVAKEAKKRKKLQKKAEKAKAKARAKENKKKRSKRNSVLPTALTEPRASVEKPEATPPVRVTDWAISRNRAQDDDVSTSPVPSVQSRSSVQSAAEVSEAVIKNEEDEKYWETNTVKVTICPKPIVVSNDPITECESPKEDAKPHKVFTRPKGAHHNNIRSVTKDMSYYNNLRRYLVQDASPPMQKVGLSSKSESHQSTDESDGDTASEFDFEEIIKVPSVEKSPAKLRCTSPDVNEDESKSSFQYSDSELALCSQHGTLEEEIKSYSQSETTDELAHTQSDHCSVNSLLRAGRGEANSHPDYGFQTDNEAAAIQAGPQRRSMPEGMMKYMQCQIETERAKELYNMN